jgi:hypothetical protein
MSNTPTQQQLGLDFTEKASKALGAARELCERHEKSAAEAQVKISTVVKRMQDVGMMDKTESDTKYAEARFAEHGTSLDILLNVIDEYEKRSAATRSKEASLNLGEGVSGSETKPVRDKTAVYSERRRGYSDVPTEADNALLRLIDS